MDTKERRTGSQTGSKAGPAPAPDPIWRPAHRSRGEKRLRKSELAFKGPAAKFFEDPSATGLGHRMEPAPSLRGALATKQSRLPPRKGFWTASAFAEADAY